MRVAPGTPPPHQLPEVGHTERLLSVVFGRRCVSNGRRLFVRCWPSTQLRAPCGLRHGARHPLGTVMHETSARGQELFLVWLLRKPLPFRGESCARRCCHRVCRAFKRKHLDGGQIPCRKGGTVSPPGEALAAAWGMSIPPRPSQTATFPTPEYPSRGTIGIRRPLLESADRIRLPERVD